MATFLMWIGALFLGSLLGGWVLSIQWEWFLVPLGAPKIGVANAVGISIVVSLLTTEATKGEDSLTAREQIIAAFGFYVVASLIYLALGAIVVQFMP